MFGSFNLEVGIMTGHMVAVTHAATPTRRLAAQPTTPLLHPPTHSPAAQPTTPLTTRPLTRPLA